MGNTIVNKHNKSVPKKIKIGTVKLGGKGDSVTYQSKVGSKININTSKVALKNTPTRIKINTSKVALKNTPTRMKIKGGLPKVKVRKNEQV